MTTPTDGEWMSAKGALEYLSLGMNAVDAGITICTRAHLGVVHARAKVLFIDGERKDDADISPQFWWARGGAALTQNWAAGDFKTRVSEIEQDIDEGRVRRQRRVEALGVTFRRADIEQIRPASAAKGASVLGASLIEQPSGTEPTPSRKVFVVHGRDDNAKNEVALFLRKIGLDDIVLHQRPNRGRHLLTKFQEEAEGASFAVILMTPDDDGGLVGGPQQKRARQNVVFELGFFVGKLGSPRVAALILPGVEKPSDFDGICWIDFGRGTNWKTELARELKEAGVPFDSGAILHA